VDTAEFDYVLPPERIAQTPAQPRDAARLLVVDRATRKVEHRIFRELPELLPPGTRLFRNNAAVFKARLRLRRPMGGQLECLLLHPELRADPAGLTWWCLLKPGRKYPPGAVFGEEALFSATVVEKRADGQCLVRFVISSGGMVLSLTEKLGEMPLPPYLARHGPEAHDVADYQTVYANPAKKVAAAAPTAGLHFTPAVLKELEQRGFSTYDLTLRVGLGTFRPIAVDRLEEHVIHREWYEIPAATRAALAEAKGGPRLAVGTTTLRALEDYFAQPHPTPDTTDWMAEAGIFIVPPRAIAGADMLLTNFHLPRSTLMCLVSAFLTPGSVEGVAWLKELYAEAISLNYRFYSYGDAMLIR